MTLRTAIAVIRHYTLVTIFWLNVFHGKFFPSINIYTFLKGREEQKKSEVEGDESSETVYFGDDEDSSESDQERTEGKEDIS